MLREVEKEMIRKIVGILFCMLLIAVIHQPLTGAFDIKSVFEKGNTPLQLIHPPNRQWQQFYGGPPNPEIGFSVQQTSDGGFVMSGCMYPTGATYSDFYLVKTNANGNVVWNQNYGGPDGEYGYEVQQTTDGGYIVGGYVYYYSTNNGDMYLVKTNTNGNLVWARVFGGTSLDEAFSVQQTNDGGYILTGFTDSFSIGRDVYLVKTDSNGLVSWQTTFGGAGSNIGNCVRQTSDGGYIIVGYTSLVGGGSVWLIKTDGSGNKQWDQTFTGGSGACVEQTTDGGYIITGIYSSGGNNDVWLIKTDSSGNKQWDVTFGGANNDVGNSVQQTSDGGYIIAGTTSSFGVGNSDAYLIKADGSGTLIWEKTMGGWFLEDCYDVDQTTDGGYIISGRTASFSPGDYDAWLAKTEGSTTFGLTLIIGQITNLHSLSGYSAFDCTMVFAIQFLPFQIVFYNSGEEITVSKTYLGVLSPTSALGFFKANI